MSEENRCNVGLDKAIEERFGVDVETLSRYAEAHKKGKALTVPCKPGDVLYQVADNGAGIEELTCNYIEVLEESGNLYPVAITVKVSNKDELVALHPSAFGMYAFSDRNEAVAALRRKLRCGTCMAGGFQQYSPECETCQHNRKGIDHAAL